MLIAAVAGPTYRPPPMPTGTHRDADIVELDLRPVEGAEADGDLAQLAKALGHKVRVAILRRVRARGGCTCGELVGELGLAQSTVSEHLRVLRDAGLVLPGVDGTRSPYRADVHRLRRLKALIGSL
jgi:ArsR family transcriptional regulator